MGGEAFKKKCREKMSQLRAEGETAAFVLHALNAVKDAVPQVVVAKLGRRCYNWRYRQGNESLSGDDTGGRALP